MRIGIVSDTHSRHDTIQRTVDLLREHQVAAVLHCGDIEDEETVRLFAELPTHFVFGNCDDARDRLRTVMGECGATIQEPFGHVEFEGVKIAFIHGDDKHLLRDVEHSGHFDFLFYGHTHQAETHRTGPTRVINPGALHRARPKTFVVLDLPGGEMTSVTVE